MLCIGKVDSASGRIEWAPTGAVRLSRLASLLWSRLQAAGGELTTESLHQLVSGYRRPEVEYAVASLYLEGRASCRHAREPIQAGASRIVHRCYWRIREPRTRAPRRRGVGA